MTDGADELAFYTTELDLSWLPSPLPHPVLRGLMVSGDRDIVVEDIPRLVEAHNAIAADWESAAIAWVAQRNAAPLLILRGVSKLRNRVIGRVFHELKLIEQWGSGIHRMINACRQAGLPEPEFEEIGSGFRVTFRRQRVAKPKRGELDHAIVEFLRQNPGASTSRIAAHIKRTSRATRSRLKRLMELGQIVALGSSAKDPHKGYHLKAE
jgi:hypothetical protein